MAIASGNLPAIAASAPPEFKGRDGVWSPEHVWVASLARCLMLGFLAIGEFSKIALVSFSSSAKGKLEKVAGSVDQVTEIIVEFRVFITSINDLTRMARIFEKAKANCFDSNSIKGTTKIEPEVFRQQTQTGLDR